MEKIPTGIEGLDLILMGGILRGQSVLIEGAPGAGKTTFGLQFIHEGIVRHGEPGLIVTFEQLPAQIYHDAANFGWDLPALEAQNRLRVVCTSPEVLRDQIQHPESLLDEWIHEMGVRRVLIDSLSHFEVPGVEKAGRRAMATSLLNALKHRGLTVLATKEASSEEDPGLSFENYIVDAVLHVANQADAGSGRRQRLVEVLKTRGQAHLSGQHPFRFGPAGVEVFPSQVAPPEAAEPACRETMPLGVAGLDHLLGGGLMHPASLLLSGETGTGKTILGLQFLHEGAERGEPGLLFLYQESPAQVRRVAESFGWDLERLEADGALRVIHEPFAGLSLSEHLWRVRDELQRSGARRVVFDSLSAMLHGVSDRPWVARERADQLVRLTKAFGATALLIAEVPVGSAQVSTFGAEESIVDAVVLLRVGREGARPRRGVQIYKARGAGHVMGEHRMRITPSGIKVFYRPAEEVEPDDA